MRRTVTERERFADRREAGDVLAGHLTAYAGRPDVVVLGLPRGGVPVAARVAHALAAPLDVLVVRKLGAPGRRELAMGAIAGVGGRVEVVRNERVVEDLRVDAVAFDSALARETEELGRRERAYRADAAPVEVDGRHVLIVDDGLATGATVRAAVAALRRRQPAGVAVAVPVASGAALEALAEEVGEIVCAWRPDVFRAVGQAYVDFGQTTDDEVRTALASARARPEDDGGTGG